MENVPLFEMLIENEMVDGVYAISLVDRPAIKSDFIMLSEQNELDRIEVKLADAHVDNMRHVVTGMVLFADQVIERIDEKTNKKYNIIFRADTIRKIAENYIIQDKKDNVTIQHKLNVNKINLIETWFVEDPKMDKINIYGNKTNVQGWAVSLKINDDDIWNEYLKTGYLKGFSLEGNFTQREIKLNEHNVDDDNLKQIFLAAYYTEEDLDSKYKWKLGAETDDRKNCPACKEHANQIKTLREWINTAIPSVPNGTIVAGLSTSYKTAPYGTYCEDKCGCQLVKIVQSKSGASISMPWGKKIKSKFD